MKHKLHWRPSRILTQSRAQKLSLALIVLFALIGIIWLRTSQAATWYASAQAETGAINGQARTIQPAAGASGNSAVSFGAPTAKRFTSTSAITALNSATTVAAAEQAIQSFASQYKLDIRILDTAPGDYFKQYATLTRLGEADLSKLKIHGAMFIDEWAKYPTEWVASTGLKRIAIVKSLTVMGNAWAAMPDVVDDTVYYVASSSATSEYYREVVHHEFEHLANHNINGTYDDSAWAALNIPGFKYGNGGASCYEPSNDCLKGRHPIPGFVTGYAASSIAEDKAETYAYLMSSEHYLLLKEWIKTDTYLAQKVNRYKQYLASKSSNKISGSYFEDIHAGFNKALDTDLDDHGNDHHHRQITPRQLLDDWISAGNSVN